MADRLIHTSDLERGLRAMMMRRGITSFLQTAFDASDFEDLIDEAPTAKEVQDAH